MASGRRGFPGAGRLNHTRFFNIRRLTVFVALAGIFNLPSVEAEGARRSQARENIPLKQTWGGKNIPRDLQSVAPPGQYVADAAGWEKLWRAWRGAEPLPQVDFDSELIVFCTTVSPNSCGIGLSLDERGDLKITSVSTLIGSDAKTFNYQLGLIDRAGIESIGGKPLAPGRAAAGESPNDEIVGRLKRATQELLDAIRALRRGGSSTTPAGRGFCRGQPGALPRLRGNSRVELAARSVVESRHSKGE